MSINIVKKTSTHNTTSRPNRDLKYIVIHYTAGTHSRSGAAANTAKRANLKNALTPWSFSP